MKALTCRLTPGTQRRFRRVLSPQRGVNTWTSCTAACSDKGEREGAVNEATRGRDSRDKRLFAPPRPERLVSPPSRRGRSSHPCGFDLVARVAHPARVVGKGLALLPFQARLHLTPPLPNYDGRWRQQRQEKWRERDSFSPGG